MAPALSHMDLIQRLFDLKQSAAGAVVSEAGYTELQERMHVEDDLEDWVLDRIEQWQAGPRERSLLLMLSGNAGDGKSDLIERIVRRVGDTADVNIVRDATHADSPTVDQMAQLAEFFAPFADDAELSPQLSLIAMNTGMALSFLAAAEAGAYGPTFHLLGQVLKSELGLATGQAEVTWEFDVVNLDRRSILPTELGPGLLEGMLDRLNPSNPEGVLWESGTACSECEVRSACFVRTNLEMLRLADVRKNLAELLSQASLEGDVHLSPRNVWDLLYQVLSGGEEFFEAASTPCEKIAELHAQGAAAVSEIHGRLLYNLLFENPERKSRGPILDALAGADPALRPGRNGHLAESAAYNDPSDDAAPAGEAAVLVGGGAETDACLERLAVLVDARRDWDEADRRLFGRGTIRRARLLGSPGAVADELADPDLGDYSALLASYRSWLPGTPAPAELHEFRREVISAVNKIFGVTLGIAGRTYFRQDSFSPATRFPAYAPVDLDAAIDLVPDPEVARGSRWLDAVNYQPRFVLIRIAGNGEGWRIRGDLSLFTLFRRVLAGYAASSVDLEAFFGLRYACERLGAVASRGDELVVQSLDDGLTYTLEERQQMGQRVLTLTEV
jgi:hypothetical protein